MGIEEAIDRQINILNRLAREEEYAIKDNNAAATFSFGYAIEDAGKVLNYLVNIKEENGD